MHKKNHARLAAHYPLQPVMLEHDLAMHPLLDIDALAEAALRMRPQDVECKAAKRPIGGAFDNADVKEQRIDATIRSIAVSDCWVMLRFIDQLPEYRNLLQGVLQEIEPDIAARTGAMHMLQAFVFISSPGTITPFHFDPEYNILFQIAGSKSFTTFPPVAPMLSNEAHMLLHDRGQNLLPWDDAYSLHETSHAMNPGDALYVPYKAPHWVKVGEQCSISISMTWSCDWTLKQGDLHRFNNGLRKIGVEPGALPDWPGQSLTKTFGGKVLRRMGIGA